MAVKLFVLGLPGSGKSTVARYIAICAGDRHWSTTHINDYAILYRMYQGDTTEQFRPADLRGSSDVIDLEVFNTALKKLEQEVKAHISSAKQEEIVLIEFSRNDYEKSFQQFSQEFLQDAYFLYLSVDLEICKRRIRERFAEPTTPDDHFVSKYIFDTYYNKDDGQDMPYMLEDDYMIDTQRVMMINNNYSLLEASSIISSFIDYMLDSMLSHHFLVA